MTPGRVVVFLWCICVIFVCDISAQAIDSKCITPNRQPGVCQVIGNCSPLLKLLQKRPLSTSDAEYLRQSQCGFQGAEPIVCCPTSSSSIPYEETNHKNPTVSTPIRNNLLPDKNQCGAYLDDRIVGGNITDIDEYPWMALIEYQKANKQTGFYCGGVLINSRYVLTAAHCVKGKDLPKSWRLISVRLGEYDTDSDTDCVDDGQGGKDCTDDPVDVPIEETIPHENYDPYDANQYHDIALIRLTRNVRFSNFIKPICIPKTAEELSKTYEGSQMFVAGWGKTETRSESNIKLKLKVPVKSNSECSTVYSEARVNLSSGQLCAGGERGRDSCRGDSGGPLMILTSDNRGNANWYAAGVVSFGPSPCGMEGWPGVYTRVNSYAHWISNKIRP